MKRRGCTRPPVGTGSALTMRPDNTFSDNLTPWTAADAEIREWIRSDRFDRYPDLRQAVDALRTSYRLELRDKHPREFAEFHAAVRALRAEFAVADWPAFERRLDKFWLAVQGLREGFLLPFARRGKKFPSGKTKGDVRESTAILKDVISRFPDDSAKGLWARLEADPRFEKIDDGTLMCKADGREFKLRSFDSTVSKARPR